MGHDGAQGLLGVIARLRGAGGRLRNIFEKGLLVRALPRELDALRAWFEHLETQLREAEDKEVAVDASSAGDARHGESARESLLEAINELKDRGLRLLRLPTSRDVRGMQQQIQRLRDQVEALSSQLEDFDGQMPNVQSMPRARGDRTGRRVHEP